MKEATGELNITVITVVAIAAVGALFYLFIWPSIQKNILLNNACSNAGGSAEYKDDQSKITCTLQTSGNDSGKVKCAFDATNPKNFSGSKVCGN